MKIAIATDSGIVSAHFGRCPEFTILEVENGKLQSKKTIPNPGHQMGYIPKFMHEQGVECLIAGGMGHRALALFKEYSIETILGITGQVDTIINKLLTGTLEGGESLCSPRSGRGYGLNRTDVDHDHQQ